jgi:hypothetical protein
MQLAIFVPLGMIGFLLILQISAQLLSLNHVLQERSKMERIHVVTIIAVATSGKVPTTAAVAGADKIGIFFSRRFLLLIHQMF